MEGDANTSIANVAMGTNSQEERTRKLKIGTAKSDPSKEEKSKSQQSLTPSKKDSNIKMNVEWHGKFDESSTLKEQLYNETALNP